MAIMEARERSGVGVVEGRVVENDGIKPTTITAIENKADLLLRGPLVRRGTRQDGIYLKVGRKKSLEILRTRELTDDQETRFYNIYYTTPDGIVTYRSVGEKATVTTTLHGKHNARQVEGQALFTLMDRLHGQQLRHTLRGERLKSGKEKLQKAATVFSRHH